jgi:hypothetical protein
VVARPDGVCPQERPAAIEGVGRGRRGRPGQQASHGVGRRCPACGVHPSGYWLPGSGCPAVRCPVTWDGRPEGPAVGRLLSTRPASSPVRCPPLRCPAVCCLPRPSGRVRLPPQAVALGTQVELAGRPWPPEPVKAPVAARAVDGSTMVQEARMRATLPSRVGQGGWSVADPGGPGWVRAAAAARAAERPGRPGRRAERPPRAAARWARVQAAARAGGSRRMAGVLGWVRDHGGWSSPRLTPGWAAPAGATGGAGGDGRAAPARPKPAASAPGSLPAVL